MQEQENSQTEKEKVEKFRPPPSPQRVLATYGMLLVVIIALCAATSFMF